MTYREYIRLKNENDLELYRIIYDKYCNYVYTIVFNILRSKASKEDIEECVSDVFADIYRYFDDEKTDDNDIIGFIGTVARRKAYRYCSVLNSAERQLSYEESINTIEAADDVETEVTDRELQKTVFNILKCLSEPDFTIIIQKFYFKKNSREISKMVSMSPQAVRVRSSRALKKLKCDLKKLNLEM